MRAAAAGADSSGLGCCFSGVGFASFGGGSWSAGILRRRLLRHQARGRDQKKSGKVAEEKSRAANGVRAEEE